MTKREGIRCVAAAEPLSADPGLAGCRESNIVRNQPVSGQAMADVQFGSDVAGARAVPAVAAHVGPIG